MKYWTADSFLADFESICEAHRESGAALLFAFLLYDFKDASLIKVLRDPDYWASLDSTSGDSVSVFALHSPNLEEAYPDLEMRKEIDEFLTLHFGDSGMRSGGSLLFFQVNDGAVIDQFRVTLRSTTVEQVFLEMKDILDVVGDSVSQVTESNRGNAQEIFNLAAGRLSNREFVLTAGQVFRTAMSVTKLGKLIASIWA
ncbi:MAG: hypothetical protein KDA69_07995 [Planctomycetaceae bacterium]|nr:hypothetical protein [Planctomycetaceae bacterium]